MGLPRRWLCVFTKDAHKKYNKRFDDGVLDVDVDDGRIARLYKAEDERPTGEHIARRALTASELEAWLRGDDLSGFEGFDVQVDREVGGEAAGAPAAAAAASAATTAPAARPHPAALAARRPYRAPAMVGGAAFRPPQRKPPASASAAARPASRPAADARDAAPKRRRVDDDSHDLDDAGGGGIGDAMLEAVTRVAGGARGFADLYAEAAPEDLGTGASSSAANAKANAEANAKAPLAARPSKWEAYDTTAKVTKHSGAPEPRAVPAGGGDEGGLAAALRRAGGGGLAALRRAGGGGLDPGGGFSTAAPAAGDPETRPRRPKPPFAARANPPTGGLAATAAPGSSELALAFPDAEDASRILGVGGRERGSSVSATRENKTTLPSAFETAAAYRAFFRETIRADLLARLAETRLVLDRVAGASPSRAVPYGSNSSGGNVRTRPAHGAAGVDAEARRLAADLRAAKPDPADYYADCHLRQDKGGVDKGFFGRPKANGAENEDDAGETSSPAAQPRKWWLHLNDQAERRGSRAYARGDLWVAGNTPRLLSSRALGEVGDRNKAPWTAVLQSLWHGPDKDGKLEVRVLTPSSGAGVSRGAGSLPKAGERRRVYAIRVEGNAASAVAEFETFANKTGTMSESAFPLLRHILGAPAESPPRVSDEDADEGAASRADARGLAAKHGLNEDQATAVAGALRAAAEAAEGRAAEALTACPVRLVHGPFGSGKTHALAAFIVEAAERLEAMKSDARILVAAHTNVAVDRLLSALAGKKFHQFVRVGRLRKIDREILPFALHVTSGGASRRAGDRDDEGPIVGESGKALRGKGADHARELRAMLRDGGAEMSAAERAALTREYDAARRGEADRRARALRTIRVVGATTASCASDALGGCSFAIAVLDECSQMTEPSSVAATARFGVRALVAVGDPQQLPPVLERKSARPEDPLARGLFARLVDAGHAPALLRTQYRLHPALAAVPNACFYGNKLVDGCSAEERAALVTVGGGGAEENGVGADGATTTARAIPMPPLTWIDVKSGGEERDGRSRLSRREAIVAAAAVSRLVELGVSPSDVGVITLYRAQAARVSRELAAARTTSPGKTHPGGGDVRVSTVDAFQGQEKEVIVLSLCGDGGGGGAFTSRERVNVALTRAKRHLIVLGDSRHSAVRSHDAWAKCLVAARRAPGGFVDAAATLTDGLLRARLAKWRSVSRTREDEPTTRIEDDGDELAAAAAADGEVEIVGERAGSPPRERDAAAALVATPADLAWEEEEAGDLAAREAKRVAGREAMAKARERAARTSADAVDREWETDEREREAEDEEAAAVPASSSSDLDESSDLDSSDLESSGSLPPRLRALRSALAAPGVGLDPEAYWRAYADVTRGCLYQDADARARFERSAVGAVAASAFRFGDAPWGDAAWNGFALRRALLRDLVPAMKAHVHATRGRRWTRLGRLIAEFDDAETLAADVGGFGAHVVGDAETQEADEEGADIFARREAPSDDEGFRPASP